MIYEVKKDLLTSEGIIAHQVNCKGVMGAGVAKQIKEKLLPADEFKKYQDTCKYRNPEDLMNGEILVHGTYSEKQLVVDLFAENEPTGKGLDTDYVALYKSFETLKKMVSKCDHTMPISIPGYIGCGLAGGDWDYVFTKILVPLFKDDPLHLYICYNDESKKKLENDFSEAQDFTTGTLKKDWHGFTAGTKVSAVKQYFCEQKEKRQENKVEKSYAFITVFTQLKDKVMFETPDLAICSEGRNLDDALRIASDAIKDKLLCLLKNGKEIPDASRIDEIDDDDLSFAGKGENIYYPVVVSVKVSSPSFSRAALRDVCIKNAWFTDGSNEQYEKLFAMNENGADIDALALIIWLCSENCSLSCVKNTLLAEGGR